MITSNFRRTQRRLSARIGFTVGTEEINLKKLVSSCTCLVLETAPKRLAPGEQATIRGYLSTHADAGELFRTAKAVYDKCEFEFVVRAFVVRTPTFLKPLIVVNYPCKKNEHGVEIIDDIVLKIPSNSSKCDMRIVDGWPGLTIVREATTNSRGHQYRTFRLENRGARKFEDQDYLGIECKGESEVFGPFLVSMFVEVSKPTTWICVPPLLLLAPGEEAEIQIVGWSGKEDLRVEMNSTRLKWRHKGDGLLVVRRNNAEATGLMEWLTIETPAGGYLRLPVYGRKKT